LNLQPPDLPGDFLPGVEHVVQQSIVRAAVSARRPDKVSCRGIFHQQRVQIQRGINILLGW